MPVLLTIAGFDPSSGAGVTADLAVAAAHGCFGTAAVTALTVQSTVGVRGVYPVVAAVLAETLACVTADLPPDAVKIGMLGTAEQVRVVAAFVAGLRVPVVLDPVLRSSSGRALLEPVGVTALVEELLPVLAARPGAESWVTPNRSELMVLAERREAAGDAAVHEAAKELVARYPGLRVIVTGGEAGTEGETAAETVDLVVARDGVERLAGPRIASRATHGTGCAFSTALACGLANGMGALEAAWAAKRYVAEAIRLAEPRGGGRGPMNLLWPLAGQPLTQAGAWADRVTGGEPGHDDCSDFPRGNDGLNGE